MAYPKIVANPLDVDLRLSDFGVNREGIRYIALAANGARNDSIAFDPKTAPGLFSYIYGVRALREVFVGNAGYAQVSRQNIEAVYDAPLRKIMFQTVDVACTAAAPKAISEIGVGKQAVIERAGRSLFPEFDREEDQRIAKLSEYERAEAWYLCVAFSDAGVTCELSRPRGVANKQFSDFDERIFIIGHDDPESGSLLRLDDDTPPIEFTPLVFKK